MRRVGGWSAIAAGFAMLAACGDDQGAGGVTPEEARQLNEISETLDTSADSLTVSDDDMLDNGSEAEGAPAAEDAAESQ